MTNSIQRKWRLLAGIGVIVGAGLAPASIAAQDAALEAGASVVIAEPVGAGIAFDVASDAVSAVFLSGDAGDSVSVLMSRRKTGPRILQRTASNNEGGLLVMASGVYRIDLFTPVSGASRMMRSNPLPSGGSILFLAQFN